MTPQATTQQIRDIINSLIVASLVNHQMYPACRKIGKLTSVIIDGSPDLSTSMKSLPYEDIYNALRSAGAYHMQMIDGALVQLLYTFENNNLLSHRLAYFPSPLLESYDEAAEFYDHEPLFGDIFSKISIRSPIRFDYSSSDKEYIDIDHPRSHMTIGKHKSCRVPVSGPLTPFRFMRFLLRNFYGPAYSSVNFDTKATQSRFADTISSNEKKILHIVG